MSTLQKRKIPFLPLSASTLRQFIDNNDELLFRAGVFVIIFLATFTIRGSESAVGLLEGESGLDLSWQFVLEYAVKHNFQFGKDIIFTFGPLGYLYTDFSQGHLFLQQLLFALAWSLFAAWAAVGVVWNLSGITRYLFLVWVVFFVPPWGGKEVIAFLIILYFGHLLLRQFNNKVAIAAFFVFIPVLSLIKFPYFIASTSVILVSVVSYAISKQYRRSLLILTAYGLLLSLLWMAIGQSLANFPSWVKGSLEIASGYSKAMSRGSNPIIFVLSIVSMLILLRAFVVNGKANISSAVDTGFNLLVALICFLAWKHGFVRNQISSFILFPPIAFTFFYMKSSVRLSETLNDKRIIQQFFAILLLCSVSLVINTKGNIGNEIIDRALNSIKGLKTVSASLSGNLAAANLALRPDEKRLKELDLPITRSIIGYSTVDVIDFQQWTAVLNNFNYHPRPIIQGYSAYTPYLQSLNLAFYESAQRPEFVILNIETIDYRFPTLDDAPLLPFLLQNYKIVGQEKGFLIMQQNGTDHRSLQLKLIHEQTVAFEQRLDLSPFNDKIFVMKVDIRPTLWGKLITTLYHAPILTMDLLVEGNELRKRVPHTNLCKVVGMVRSPMQ
jgi:hypothetical protein